MFAGDSPEAPSPRIADNAAGKSFVDIPLRYRTGMRLSILGILRRYLGKILLVNLSLARLAFRTLSSTLGCFT